MTRLHILKENNMSKSETKSLPAYRIFSVVKDEQNDKAVWTEVGSAWANKDGKGLNLYFKARPLAGASIVLREPVAKTAAAASEATKRRKAA
jgi:hypothetical protein